MEFNKRDFLKELVNKVLRPWVKDGNEPIKTYEDERWDEFIEYAKTKLNLEDESEETQDLKIDIIIDATVNLNQKKKTEIMKENSDNYPKYDIAEISRKLRKGNKLKGSKKIGKTELYEMIREEVLGEQSKKKLDPKSLESYNKELEKTKDLFKKLKDETEDM
jgi:hypothetical protein